MDLEVVGRHVLFFDDDVMAAFVNSPDALVGWSSLSIDRYDVRHLLSAPPAPRFRRRRQSSPFRSSDDSLESELDYERYLDLPPPSDDEEPGTNSGAASVLDNGFHAVGFSYRNTEIPIDQIADDTEPGFQPPFHVPEGLLQNLPPTEKLHQIIARTATFVSKNGGQSEIVLRVKQGDNPTFGFLMPDHRLHPYFRFLIDHQELLKPDNEEKSSVEQASGALSLLGTVYGDGEEEDNAAETSPGKFNAVVVKEDSTVSVSHGPDLTVPSAKSSAKDGSVSKHLVSFSKEKSSIVKKSRSISMVNAGSEGALRKDGEASVPRISADKKKSSALPTTLAAEKSIPEPPYEMKRLVDKIVEFILKNGRQFESILSEQDKDHGRFPFLQLSNKYHLFYLKALEKAEQLKLPVKKDMAVQGAEKKFENDDLSVGSDIPDDLNRKERFKMVIVRTKREGQEQPSKAPREENGVKVDAAAAAAILQAARRGIKNPKLEILPRPQPLHGEGGHGSDSPQPLGGSSIPTGSTTTATASEAESSQAGLTKEQKLKAERLKRAKMFTAMLKSGAVASKASPLDSVVSGLIVEAGPSWEGEGSSLPPDSDANERNERRLKRSYRSRNKIQNEDDEEEGEEENDEVVEDKEREDSKHTRKKRRSHGSSRHSKERHKKHRKKDSSYGRHRHDDISTDEEEHRHKRRSRHRHRHVDDMDGSSDGEGHRHRKHRSRRKHGSSGDDSYEDDHHERRHKRECIKEREDLEEGGELGESKAGRLYIREASVDASGSSHKASESSNEVPDDLRAKIRAMLMATM
ncbi:hypothetical protein SAY87_002948 [Trapa incisa]|uniref:SURP motif domain-containing protein n=1 Tax=Trapa incisa TaxID=236973 RepID=A0AAN7QH46_9MYRT|nr:hypothetical protein SAY87_002948 [Trapa incisa]